MLKPSSRLSCLDCQLKQQLLRRELSYNQRVLNDIQEGVPKGPLKSLQHISISSLFGHPIFCASFVVFSSITATLIRNSQTTYECHFSARLVSADFREISVICLVTHGA